VKKELTLKEQEILELVYRFRFLDTNQIQKLLNHTHSSRVKAWLLNLTKEGYLQRHYKRTWGENRKPSIYFLDKKGGNFIKKTYGISNPHLNHLDYEGRVSLSTSGHFLTSASFYLKLRDLAKQKNYDLEYYTETDLRENSYYNYLKPDSHFILSAGSEKRHFFTIIDLETANRSVLRKKIDRYLNYYQNDYWQIDFQTFPETLIFCLTERRKEHLIIDIKRELESYGKPSIEFRVSTLQSIENGLLEDL
jgi:Replication-relaxation